MNRFASVKPCLCLPRNTRGRDFVVGDLHGHRALLEHELSRLAFDPRCDRVLSVGDLIDRGPDSLATLSLIEEPWFHAVLGNHELMLLNYLCGYGSRLYSKKTYANGAGAWIVAALAGHRRAVERLAERLADLPLAIHVDGEVPYNVTHADLPSGGFWRADPPDAARVGVHRAEKIASSRQRVASALKAGKTTLRFGQQPVQVSHMPLAERPITYVGHSPMNAVTVHASYVHIDQGVAARSASRPVHTPPTVLEHARFAHWLVGVATAHRSMPSAAAGWSADGLAMGVPAPA